MFDNYILVHKETINTALELDKKITTLETVSGLTITEIIQRFQKGEYK